MKGKIYSVLREPSCAPNAKALWLRMTTRHSDAHEIYRRTYDRDVISKNIVRVLFVI